MPSSAYREALLAFHRRLRETDVAWALTASMNLAVQGVEVDPGDIDVMTDAAGAYRIEEVFDDEMTRPVVPPSEAAKEHIRSYFGALELYGVEIEVMGDVEHRPPGADEWTPVGDVTERRTFVEVDGYEVPAMPLEEELRGYRDLGRDERVRQLESYLDGEGT